MLLLVVAVGSLLAAYVFLATSRPLDRVVPPPRSNVVLVTIDTLRADRVGVYGGPKGLTPNLDALAHRGVTFLDATAHAPLTVPSHASILTGWTPLHHHVRDNAGFPLPAASRTLAEVLRAAGYHTAAFVSSFVLSRTTGLSRGFDEYDDEFPAAGAHVMLSEVQRRGPETSARAGGWLRGAREPFFLWTHFYDPHAPYDAPPAFRARWPSRPYEAEVAAADWALGDLIAAMAPGVRDRTLWVVTGDHGESLGEHGENEHGIFLYDSTLRIPLVMAGPGIRSGVLARQQVRHVDIVPTVLDLLNARSSGPMDGTSLMAAAGGAERPSVPLSFAESEFCRLHFGWSALHAVRDGTWKYIEAPEPELYDLRDDPPEQRNQYPARAEIAEALKREVATARRTSNGKETARTPDSATVERLRALGYVSGPRSPTTSKTGDDPKRRIGDYAAYVATFNGALSALDAGDARLAEQRFRRLTARFPDSFEAHQYLGRALAALKAYDKALEEYAASLRLNPRNGGVHFDAARTLAARREFNRAFEHVEAGARIEPKSFYGYLTEGLIARAAGQTARASRAFEESLAINPKSAVAEYELGALAEARGDRGAAAARYRNAIADDPGFADARAALGRLEGH